MNMRNRMARFASRASSDYHTYLFFKVFLLFILNLFRGKKLSKMLWLQGFKLKGFL